MDLPPGLFHFAEVRIKGGEIKKVLEGEIIEKKGQKQMWDLLGDIKYPSETEVVTFQKNEE